MQLFAAQLPLFAEDEFPTWIFVIAIVAIVLLFAGFLSWLIFRQAAKSRDLSHLERMKGLEVGKATEIGRAHV